MHLYSNPAVFSSDDESDGSGETVGSSIIWSGSISDKFLTLLLSSVLSERKDKEKDKNCLFLKSEGGCLYAATSVVDWLEQNPLTTVATGSCMSAAVPIVAAGQKGRRLATHRTRFMLHSVWAELPAVHLNSLKKEAEEMEYSWQAYCEMLARHTGKYDVNWWKKKCNTEAGWYFSPEEAVDLGIIDSVVEDSYLLEALSPSKKLSSKTTKRKAKKTKKKK